MPITYQWQLVELIQYCSNRKVTLISESVYFMVGCSNKAGTGSKFCFLILFPLKDVKWRVLQPSSTDYFL